MRCLLLSALVLLVLGSCSTAPTVAPAKMRTIQGSVTYPNGTPVAVPKVFTSLGTTVLGDQQGHYRMQVPLTAAGITLVARDGYAPGLAYIETTFGTATVPDISMSPVTVNIILTSSTPI